LPRHQEGQANDEIGAFVSTVLGYLDAGSGSMILQAILGGAAGMLVALKMFGKRVWSFIFFWRKDEEPPPEA
jgi:hypothetical protein